MLNAILYVAIDHRNHERKPGGSGAITLAHSAVNASGLRACECVFCPILKEISTDRSKGALARLHVHKTCGDDEESKQNLRRGLRTGETIFQ